MRVKNVRFIIAAITTFSAYAVYVSRVNLSIAIIAMVEDHHGEHKLSERQVNATLQDPSPAPTPLTLDQQQQQLDVRYTAAAGTSTVGGSQPVANISYNLINSNFSSPLTALNNQSSALPTGQQQVDSNNNATKLHREPLSTIFPASKKSVKTPLISQEKFHWDQTEQGHILGAFFYGYILFQIPGARMAESMGAKWIIMASTAGSALISLAFPLSTQLNSIHLLMVLRFVMGLCQSAFFPAAYVLFCRWLPERERAILLPIMFIGSNMGSISTYTMSSYLISSSYGWPSVFYLSGLVCTIVSVSWMVVGSNGPEDNWLITEKEILFIELNVNNQSSESSSLKEDDQSQAGDGAARTQANGRNKSSLSGQLERNKQQQQVAGHLGNNSNKLKPLKANLEPLDAESNNLSGAQKSSAPVAPEPSWSKFFKSIPIWTLILSMYGNEWSNVVLCFELPTYLNTALGFPIEQNGVINSFFQLSYTVASPIMSSLGAYMLDKHICSMRKIHVRKLFQSIATFGQMVCFVSIPICGANRGLIILLMFSAVVCKTCANAGDIMVAGDLSPEYAGTIFAFANTIGNTAGFLVPLLAGVIVENPYEREQWTPFWFTTATIMGCSGLIFLIFGETRRQDFEKDRGDCKLDQLVLPPLACCETERMLKLTNSNVNNNSHNHNNLAGNQKLMIGNSGEAQAKIHRINTALF